MLRKLLKHYYVHFPYKIKKSNVFFKNLICEKLSSIDKQYLLGFHISQLSFKKAQALVANYFQSNEIENPKIFETFIIKCNDASLALEYLDYCINHSLSLDEKPLYKILNLVENYSDSLKIIQILEDLGHKVDEKALSNLFAGLGEKFFDTHADFLIDKVDEKKLNMEYVVNLAIRKLDSYSKIKNLLKLSFKYYQRLVPSNYLSAIINVSSFKDGSEFFWYFYNNTGKVSERHYLAIIRKANSWGHVQNILNHIVNEKEIYIDDKFLLNIIQKSLTHKQAIKLVRKFKNNNENGLKDEINFELTKRISDFWRMKKESC